MLSYMRKHARSWVVKGVLGLIIVVFTFWGVGTYRSGEKGVLAYVGKEPITVLEFQKRYREVLKNYESLFKKPIDRKLAKALGLPNFVLEGLIKDKIISNEAKNLGIGVTDKEVLNYIKSISAFQTKGKFDKRKYFALLRANRKRPEEFEEDVERDILEKKFLTLASSFSIVPDVEKKVAALGYFEKRRAKYIIFSPKRINIEPKRKDIEEFFSKNMGRYKRRPEYNLAYIKTPDLCEDDIIEIYYLCLRDKKSLSEILKDRKVTPKYTGYFQKSDPPSFLKGTKILEGIEKFGLNDVFPPIRIGEKLYLFGLQGKKKGGIPPLDEVFEKVKDDYLNYMAKKKAKEDAVEAKKLILEGKSIDEVSKRFQRKVYDTGYITRDAKKLPGLSSPFPVIFEIFKMKMKKGLKVSLLPQGDRFFLISLVDVVKGQYPKSDKDFSKIILRQKREEVFQSLFSELKKREKIKVLKDINTI